MRVGAGDTCCMCVWCVWRRLCCLAAYFHSTLKAEKPVKNVSSLSSSSTSSPLRRQHVQLNKQKQQEEERKKEARRKLLLAQLGARNVRVCKSKYVDDYINGCGQYSITQVIELLRLQQAAAEQEQKQRELQRQQQRERALLQKFTAVRIN